MQTDTDETDTDGYRHMWMDTGDHRHTGRDSDGHVWTWTDTGTCRWT